jgi:hypothetical protein
MGSVAVWRAQGIDRIVVQLKKASERPRTQLRSDGLRFCSRGGNRQPLALLAKKKNCVGIKKCAELKTGVETQPKHYL